MSTSFGTAIRLLRKKRGLTLTQVAERISVSYPAVQQWEADRTSPTLANLKKLSQAMGADIRYIEASLESGSIRNEAELDEYLDHLINEFDKREALREEAESRGIDPRVYISYSWDRAQLLEKRREFLADNSGYHPSPTLLPVAETICSDTGEDFIITGNVADYVARPFGLATHTRVFGIVLTGSQLSPRHESGDLVVYNEQAVAEANDFAIIAQRMTSNDFPKRCKLRRIIDITQNEILASQLSPARYDRFLLAEQWEAYPIVSLRTMLSI